MADITPSKEENMQQTSKPHVRSENSLCEEFKGNKSDIFSALLGWQLRDIVNVI